MQLWPFGSQEAEPEPAPADQEHVYTMEFDGHDDGRVWPSPEARYVAVVDEMHADADAYERSVEAGDQVPVSFEAQETGHDLRWVDWTRGPAGPDQQAELDDGDAPVIWDRAAPELPAVTEPNVDPFIEGLPGGEAEAE